MGYAWVKGASILQKLPHPHVYEYDIVEGFSLGARRKSRDALLSQGFAAVGRFGSVPIYMRDTVLELTLTSGSGQRDIRFLDRSNKRKFLKQVSALAAQGYRYRSAELTDSGQAMTMERCDSACGGPFEYRTFDVKNAEQLERTLNDLARDGFRVVADSLDWMPYLAEGNSPSSTNAGGGSAESGTSYSYRVANARDAESLEQFVNTAAKDGFQPVGFAAHVGWTAEIFIIVEKAGPLAAP